MMNASQEIINRSKAHSFISSAEMLVFIAFPARKTDDCVYLCVHMCA